MQSALLCGSIIAGFLPRGQYKSQSNVSRIGVWAVDRAQRANGANCVYLFLLTLIPASPASPIAFRFRLQLGNVPHDPRLTWAAQECNMECPPAESTTGYVWSEYGWICAPGWTGTAPWRRYKSKTWWKMRKTKQEQGEPTYNPFAT